MSPEMRRRNRWFWDNDILHLSPVWAEGLGNRFGDRLAGGRVEPSGDS